VHNPFFTFSGKAHDSRFKRDRQNARLTMHKPAPTLLSAPGTSARAKPFSKGNPLG